MVKIKIGAMIFLLGLVGIVLNGSHHFSSHAETDAADEIAKYKNWSKITKKPIKVESEIELGDGKKFVVDGQEVTNFRTGDSGG